MDGNGSNRMTGIRQIVRLKEMLQKWQSVTLNPKGSNSVHSATYKSLGNSDEEEDGGHSPEPPPDVPKGYLAVKVGPEELQRQELRRFIIPTAYLNHSVFKELLKKVEQEFGFHQDGVLTIPCEIETFKYLLDWIGRHPEDHPNENNTLSVPLLQENEYLLDSNQLPPDDFAQLEPWKSK